MPGGGAHGGKTGRTCPGSDGTYPGNERSCPGKDGIRLGPWKTAFPGHGHPERGSRRRRGAGTAPAAVPAPGTGCALLERQRADDAVDPQGQDEQRHAVVGKSSPAPHCPPSLPLPVIDPEMNLFILLTITHSGAEVFRLR